MAQIYYHDIGDYLSRDEKLNIIRSAGSIEGLEWTEITPNDKHDWINQRDGVFDTLLPLAPEKHGDQESKSAISSLSLGVGTNRDAWVYNYSHEVLAENMQRMIDFYNSQLGEAAPSLDPTQISWTRGLKKKWEKDVRITYDEQAYDIVCYRPFSKCAAFVQEELVEYPAIRRRYFPFPTTQNLCICVSGAAGTKDFSCIITDTLPDLHFCGDAQCFPLYWYEENKAEQSLTLFAEDNKERWTQRDGISDWMLTEVRSRFVGTKSLTKEDVFYYIYGVLHSPDYRTRFADDLRKTLPRIPIAERVEDFMAFAKAGRELAALHLHYEDFAHEASGTVVHEADYDKGDEYAYYAVEKMRFPKKGERTSIVYNSRITLDNIPEAAYDYVVNGKSAIEWVMERYAVMTDKKSGIKNDPNLWAREHEQPRYILDLLLSIIHVSLETQNIVAALPPIEF